MANGRFPLNMGDAARLLASESKAKVEEQFEESKKIIEWSKQPITQEVLKELQDKEQGFIKKMNKGGCKDYIEYLGYVFAINKVKGLADIIQKHINNYNRVIAAKQKEKDGK